MERARSFLHMIDAMGGIHYLNRYSIFLSIMYSFQIGFVAFYINLDKHGFYYRNKLIKEIVFSH